MRSIKAIYNSFWNKDDSFQNEAEMFRNIVCTGISRNIVLEFLTKEVDNILFLLC